MRVWRQLGGEGLEELTSCSPSMWSFPQSPPTNVVVFITRTTPCWEAGGDTGRRSERQPLNQLQAPTETTIAGKEAEMLD